MRQFFILTVLTLSLTAVLGQTVTFKGVTVDNETHDTVPNVKMQLLWLTPHSNDTLTTISDKHGFFSFTVDKKSPAKYYFLTADKKYRQGRHPVSDSGSVITIYLNEPGFTDYFPEFLFDKNSTVPQDTNIFYWWELNKIGSATMPVTKKIQVKGYYAPDEDKSLGQKRAQAIVDGYVKRGANRQSFIIQNDSSAQTTLYYGHYVNYKGTDYFFKKGAIINSKYIDNLSGDNKEAGRQLLRAVRLTWYSDDK